MRGVSARFGGGNTDNGDASSLSQLAVISSNSLSREAEENDCVGRYSNTLSHSYEQSANNDVINPKDKSPKIERRRRPILDGFLLLEAAHVEFPDLATKANLNGRGLCEVQEDDLAYYHRLSFADLGENRLNITQLTSLSGLEELRLQCNEISHISKWRDTVPFPMLHILDLSFNFMTTKAVGMLSALPRLRELDLTCNELSVIPDNMELFASLEVLVLAQNQLELENCMRHLSLAPKLRELDCSDNRFMSVPEDVDFPRLEWLNLVNNLLSRQSDVEALLSAPELMQVLLYGNPITKGKRINTKRSIASVVGSSNTALASYSSLGMGNGNMNTTTTLRALSYASERFPSSHEMINVVTDAPNIRTGQSKGKTGKSRGMYAHFQITQVADHTIRKPSGWRAQGNKALFALINKEEEEESDDEEEISNKQEEDEVRNEAAERREIAECNEYDEFEVKVREDDPYSNDNAEGSIFMTEPSLFNSAYSCTIHNNNEEEKKEETNSMVSYSNEEHVQPQSSLNLHTMTGTKSLRAALVQHGSSFVNDCDQARHWCKPSAANLQNATSALRHALKHPLTSHADLDMEEEADLKPNMTSGNGYLDPASTKQFTSSFARFEKSTNASKLKQKPKVRRDLVEGLRAKKVGGKAAVPTALHKTPGEKKDLMLLNSIESVLDRMDFNNRNGAKLYELHHPGAKTYTERTADNLTSLANNVMNQYEL